MSTDQKQVRARIGHAQEQFAGIRRDLDLLQCGESAWGVKCDKQRVRAEVLLDMLDLVMRDVADLANIAAAGRGEEP